MIYLCKSAVTASVGELYITLALHQQRHLGYGDSLPYHTIHQRLGLSRQTGRRCFPCISCFACSYDSLHPHFLHCQPVNSVEEDRINKPDRPLVQGLVTEAETRRRFVAYSILFPYRGHMRLQLLWPARAWMIVTQMLCKWGCSSHWFTENVVCFPSAPLLCWLRNGISWGRVDGAM